MARPLLREGYQTPESPRVDRKDHVWLAVLAGPKENEEWWKCSLCGAMTQGHKPPDYPTPPAWMPRRYEALNDDERAQCAYVPGR